MNEQEILKHKTIFFLEPSETGGVLHKAERNERQGGWNFYELYRSDWEYDDNISDESLIRRAQNYKVLIECPLN